MKKQNTQAINLGLVALILIFVVACSCPLPQENTNGGGTQPQTRETPVYPAQTPVSPAQTPEPADPAAALEKEIIGRWETYPEPGKPVLAFSFTSGNVFSAYTDDKLSVSGNYEVLDETTVATKNRQGYTETLKIKIDGKQMEVRTQGITMIFYKKY